ncbi:MAG: SH3 domain-containing protein, partial [Acidobacteria bacterium]|nr:SH3 domain-containing protein [Acidobacteriota bacterium]
AAVTVNEGERLMLRDRPGNGRIIGRLENGTKIIILGATTDSEWFRITTELASGLAGWVFADLVRLDDPTETNEILIISDVVGAPPPTAALAQKSLDLEHSETGTLAPGTIRSYSFTLARKPLTLILLFKPDVNLNFRYHLLKFSIFRSENDQDVGVGSYYGQTQDTGFGGLVWQGGEIGESYSLIISNDSSETVEYCLAPRQVYNWEECNQ